ncbi:hypothetical protein [Nannocystis pusilla]|uniref:Uncharacterized protein n=1 Tax=Nannocystis pusilla TaxID=889268 RepID=A0ABS7TMJ0_9BACT|nr:hypothetical protein [Nannocystis pusilla]MBZ5709306.1 hypothetical protein [Nannocystis pusilla]
MYEVPTFMEPRKRCYFTPVLWKALPPQVEREVEEWRILRERFARVRRGEFAALDGLLELYPSLKSHATRMFACNLLGDAGTDEHLQAVETFILEVVWDIDSMCELCHALGLWGRLSAVKAILWAYDRNFPGQCAEGIPAYLTTMLEPEFGAAANYPRKDTLEAFLAYETGVRELWQRRLIELGGPSAYSFFGGPFSVRRVAERFLQMLGTSSYENMMKPYLRQRFEACTGIDCSDFFETNGDLKPLTAAARLEAWLESDAPDRFEPGERYFFGHKIPRRS